MNTVRQLFSKTPAGRTAAEARAAVESAEAERAESERLLAETRAQLAADHTEFATEIVALAFQLGRMQGHAEAAQDRIAEMAAEAGQVTP